MHPSYKLISRYLGNILKVKVRESRVPQVIQMRMWMIEKAMPKRIVNGKHVQDIDVIFVTCSEYYDILLIHHFAFIF